MKAGLVFLSVHVEVKYVVGILHSVDPTLAQSVSTHVVGVCFQYNVGFVNFCVVARKAKRPVAVTMVATAPRIILLFFIKIVLFLIQKAKL
jgi:hypothetical protein